MSAIIDVAAAVIERADGAFLLGRRPAGTPWAGYWEFPGGKLEPGETPRVALLRELREELAIDVEHCLPWLVREHVYPHAHVRLHFFRVTRWRGEPQQHQHDALAWQHAAAPSVTPMLPANRAVLRALTLPDFYAISDAARLGVKAQLERLARALARGLRLLQIREPRLAPGPREAFAGEAVRLARQAGARVLIHDDIDLARRLAADGVHLPSARLMALSARPELPWVAASCHDAAELAQAARLDLDFVVLGPVQETASHPGARGIGWRVLADLLRGYAVPAYALGGLRREDLARAREAGASGVAAIRAAWQET